MAAAPIVSAIVLAAGAGRRFGGGKLVAELDGRPVLQHVIDRLSEAGLDAPIVVLPPDAAALEAAIEWRGSIRVTNPEPARGLASSLQVGWATILPPRAVVPPVGAVMPATPDAVVVALGDQPRVSIEVLRQLVASPLEPGRPLVAPRYRDGGGSNPVRVEAGAGWLVAAAQGDRGLGPLIDRHAELVRWLDVAGANLDIDTRADLTRLRRHGLRDPAGD